MLGLSLGPRGGGGVEREEARKLLEDSVGSDTEAVARSRRRAIAPPPKHTNPLRSAPVMPNTCSLRLADAVPALAVTDIQYAAQKESEEEGKANGTSSSQPAAAAADEANGATDADGQPVSSEMATMLAVDSKRASTAAIRAQVG